jgi:hypothetical protein
MIASNRYLTGILGAIMVSVIFSSRVTLATESKAIALVLKSTGDVKLKRAGTDRVLPLKFGTILDNGDWIRSGDDGFAVLMFTDDKSQIKISAKTEVEIEGKRDTNSNITKRVKMEVGQILAKVDVQRGSLQIATPTSVASVKGTEFWVVVLDDGTTQVITLEGLVELLNTQSGRVVDVHPGQRGESNPNGDVMQDIPPDEDIPNDQDKDEATPHSIEIDVQDSDGRTRHVIIEYEER